MTLPSSDPRDFTIVVFAPFTPSRPAVAAAATRAGGIGVLDLEFATGLDAAARAIDDLHWLIDHTSASARIGVRLAPEDAARFATTLEALGERDAVIVLTHPPDAAIANAVRQRADTLMVEVRSAADLSAAALIHPDAVIACGHECGGYVGEETTFVLVQRALASGIAPVYARGGVGLRAAAGCRAAGARGVVLDDQLLLVSESALAGSWRQHLKGLGGQETSVLGPAHGARCRVLDRPAFGGVAALKAIARDVETNDSDQDAWVGALSTRVAWGPPATSVWPVGQGMTMAEPFARHYGSAEHVVRAFMRDTAEIVRNAARVPPLAEGSALAASHGTAFPIVQGPMTRVSDVPEFAAAVAEAGALPLVALAVLTAAQARPLLEATRDRLGARPWGVGILGFVPPDLKRLQLDEIRRIRPRFALIAGGRPDEAQSLEAEGIATYLHVPAPSLLRRFLGQGARRFVFEGRECGGHVGPLGSFPLWESMTDVLLEWTAREDGSALHVLFAGGVHDATSAAIVSAFAAPLAARGVKCGVLMGTAYLFTDEAVATGAITAAYRREAIDCRETVLLVSGVGHANRVARTAFTREFADRRQAMLQARRTPQEVREELEQLTLGRLRLASKGRVRDDKGALVETSAAQQAADGIYMLGQVAALRQTPCTMRDLHRDIANGSRTIVSNAAQALAQAPSTAERRNEAVAIIGMSLLVPGSRLPEQLWRQLLDQVRAIREVPPERWDVRVLFDADKNARDKINSKWGGFCEEVQFDPLQYRIPPAAMPQLCAHQLLALEVTRWALADAGYLDRNFDRAGTAVILGVAETGGLLGNAMILRAMLPFLLDAVPGIVLDRLPEWTGESFTGLLGNVTAGRVANHFDLGGANFCIDAACATSLLALDLAVREIREGRASMAIAGGVDTLQTPFGYTAFAKTQALSPTGEARVFDKSADGIVISEGVVVTVLKRLDAALSDGDKVYAIVRGSGASADGRGLGLTAPRPEGQRRAIGRALADAGVAAETIGMYEAHGTGTSLGDRTEIDTLSAVLREAGAPSRSCVVGSAKSLIGHTKAAAGLVGTVKGVMALRHKALPPHAGVTDPLDSLADPSSPLCLLNRPRPWFSHAGQPRRAGINAFGFGGTNAALVLESAGDDMAAPLGADEWPSELFVFAGASGSVLAESIAAVRLALEDGAQPRLRDLAFSLALASEQAAAGPRAAIVAASLAELQDGLQYAERAARGEDVTCPSNVIVGAPSLGASPRIAFLFPGQGSQSPHMALDQALYFVELRDAIELANVEAGSPGATELSATIYPDAAFTPADVEHQRQALAATDCAQPAIGAISAGLLDLLDRLGVRGDLFAGHSYGELTAVHAAGGLSRRALLRLSVERGRAMASGCDGGGMLAIHGSREQITALIHGVDDVVLANHNAPRQCVVSGAQTGIETIQAAAASAGVMSSVLAVAGAFHSPLMNGAVQPWRDALTATAFTPLRRSVIGTENGERYPADAELVRERLARQLLRPVDFVAQIEHMYESGARIFVEVGPGAVLTRLATSILAARPHVAVATDPLSGSLKGLLTTLGTLITTGVPVETSRLFDLRDVQPLALERLRDKIPVPPPATAWWVDGGGARRTPHTRQQIGRHPLLTSEPSSVTAQSASPESKPIVPAVPGVPSPASTRSVVTPVHTLGVPFAVAADGAADDVLAVYAAFQETMRKFLAVQEQVFTSSLVSMGPPGVVGAPGALPVAPPADVPSVPPAETAPPGVRASAPAAEAPPPATAAAPATDVSRDELQRLLLRIFASHTGYPVEMLGLEMDLAGDLGVDSIRQVQALGEFGDALPAALRAEMAPMADELLRLRTLGAILDRLSVITDPIGKASSGQAVSVDRPADVLDTASVIRALQQLVAERTGYPVEMLDPAHDLEVDLGVDSIRRVDLVQAFIEMLPRAVRPSSDHIDRILRARTILQIAECVTTLTGSSAAPVVTPPAVQTAPLAPCPSFAIREVGVPLDRTRARPCLGTILITEDELGVAPLVQEACRRHGLRTLTLPRTDLVNRAALRRRLEHVDESIAAVLHLAPLGRSGMPATLEGWRERTQIEAKSLFHILSVLSGGGRFDASQFRVVAASMMGGRYGRNGQLGPGTPNGGAAVGLLRTMLREWPRASASAVDLEGEMDPGAVAATIVDELRFGDEHLEIGYVGGARRVFGTAVTARDSGAADPTLEPQPGWVVLATGGARGITAEALFALARPGVTVIVAGRTRMPGEEPQSTAALDESGLRRHFIAEASGHGARATPAQIGARVRDVLRDREMRTVHDALVCTGAMVVPRVCDVRDAHALPTLVAWIYKTYGRLDAVVHGAGIIEDALIAKKDWDSFDRVFDTKVDSLFQLSRAVRSEGLKLFVLFSSVAGRAGNEGQGDYAAANEVLNRFAWLLHAEHPMARVVSIAWGPWASRGMASDSVRARLLERGIEPIEPAAGRALLAIEMVSTRRQDVEIVAGLGPWDEGESGFGESQHEQTDGDIPSRVGATGNSTGAGRAI